MSQRDTIDGKTAAEAILSRIIEQVANMPTDSAFHARSAVMVVNRMVVDKLYQPSSRAYHLRVTDVGIECKAMSERPYIDKYEKQVYEAVANTAKDYFDAVTYHENMEAPSLPF